MHLVSSSSSSCAAAAAAVVVVVVVAAATQYSVPALPPVVKTSAWSGEILGARYCGHQERESLLLRPRLVSLFGQEQESEVVSCPSRRQIFAHVHSRWCCPRDSDTDSWISTPGKEPLVVLTGRSTAAAAAAVVVVVVVVAAAAAAAAAAAVAGGKFVEDRWGQTL